MFTFALFAVALCGVVPASSAAFVSGQQEAWTITFGGGTGEPNKPELHLPMAMASNPNDGSVYVSDLTEDFSAVRIQKFAQNGNPLGVSESIPVEPTGPVGIIGIGLDPAAGAAGSFYVLLTQKAGPGPAEGKYVGAEVRKYSTVPNGSGQLEKLAEFTLPAAGSGEALVTPSEIAVDPTTGELVILARDEANKIIVQRVNPQTHALTSRYTEAGTTIAGTGGATLHYGMAVAKSGKTYIVTSAGSGAQSGIRAYTLPPALNGSALTPVPGFATASTAEAWPAGGELTGEATLLDQYGKGSQMAVATAEDGSETLFYKTLQKPQPSEEEPGKFVVHGYSVTEEATSVLYGNGVSATTEGECTIQTRSAALAVGKNGTLAVLDQGPFAELPTFGPNLFRFGPDAGTSCHLPAAALELKSGGSKVTTVPTGTTVTLDGSASELNGQTLTETFWTIKGPVGSTAQIAGPATSTTKAFNTPGTYTVYEKIQTSAPQSLGTTVTAVPQTLVVTGSAPPTPTVTSVSPAQGTTLGGVTITIEGTNLGSPTGVSFGGTAGTNVVGVSATKLTVTSPAHAAGEVDVTVTTGGGTSATGAADKFTFQTPVPTTPTVTSVSPNHGSTAGGETITIEGTNLTGPTGVSFGGTAGTNVTEVSATKLTVKSPAHAAGQVDVIVAATAGTSSAGASDKFTYEAPTPVTFKLTLGKAGDGSGTFKCNGGTCSDSYIQGTVVTLEAVPDAGNTFGGWSGGTCAGTGACKVTMNGAVTATATFNKVPPPGGGGGGGNNNGGGGGGGGTKPSVPDNTVKPGAVKPSGSSATLTLTVPGPGAIVVSGKGLVGAKFNAKKAGPVQLKLALSSAGKKQLARQGKVTVKVKIVFTPTGGSPGVTTKTVTFKAKKAAGKK